MKNDLERYQNDICHFAREQFYIPSGAGAKLIRLEPHQVAILSHVFEPGPDERFRYSQAIYSSIKKSGKSCVSALVALWCCLREPHSEVYVLSNDLEQSLNRVFAAVLFCVEHNPALRSGATITQRRITFNATGSYVEGLPSDYASAAGADPSCTIWDELWGYTSERSHRLWDEMANPPTRLTPIRWISTTAGFSGESDLLWGLYDKTVVHGEPVQQLPGLPCTRSGKTFAYWDTGEAARRMPWQRGDVGEEYYKQQREELRAGSYLRLHCNQWTGGTEQFLSAAEYDSCVIDGLRPVMSDKNLDIVVAVDLGLKNDYSAVVAVSYVNKIVRVTKSRVWRPLFGTVSIEAVMDYCRQLAADFRMVSLMADPWQSMLLLETLQREGLPAKEYSQTADHLTRMASVLADLFKTRSIQLYQDADLRRAVLNCSLTETSRGLKLEKTRQSGKVDLAVALAMSAVGVLEQLGELGGVQSMPNPWTSSPGQFQAWKDGTWDLSPATWDYDLNGPNARKMRLAKHADTDAHRQYARHHEPTCEQCYREWVQTHSEQPGVMFWRTG